MIARLSLTAQIWISWQLLRSTKSIHLSGSISQELYQTSLLSYTLLVTWETTYWLTWFIAILNCNGIYLQGYFSGKPLGKSSTQVLFRSKCPTSKIVSWQRTLFLRRLSFLFSDFFTPKNVLFQATILSHKLETTLVPSL